MNKPTVYLHTAEYMPEIPNTSVDLFIGSGVFRQDKKKQCLPWHEYAELYYKVYITEGIRVLKKDGIFLNVQTNAYSKGKFICRYKLLLHMMEKAGYTLIDERVWERCKMNMFQVPFSHILVFIPPDGTAKRRDLTKRSKEWWHGIFRYSQTEGGEQNGWPINFCKLVVEACTDKHDFIVDAFAGKGNLLSTAYHLSRRAVGYEIDPTLVGDLQSRKIVVVKDGTILKPKYKGLLY